MLNIVDSYIKLLLNSKLQFIFKLWYWKKKTCFIKFELTTLHDFGYICLSLGQFHKFCDFLCYFISIFLITVFRCPDDTLT